MKYDEGFFDYVDAGAINSARIVVALLERVVRPKSVLDVGCGRGGWLRAWKEAGCSDVRGLDGDYVQPASLYISRDEFSAYDLTKPFDLGRRFDIVQSLEVAEHLPSASADAFVASLVKHGDVILFSAAVPGQGGTRHVNEQPLEFWRDRFARHGYRAFDFVRLNLGGDERIEPWYRWNSVLYANQAGALKLPAEVHAAEVPPGVSFEDYTTLPWQMRKAVVRLLPVSAVDKLAALNARLRRIRGA